MNTPVSNINLTVFDNFIKGKLPASLVITDSRRQNIITSIVSKIHSLYTDNNKGVYDDIVRIYFYNAAQNDFINTRDLTRWVGISGANLPDGFRAVKLLSCNLQSAEPDFAEMPPGIAYIQEITISVIDSATANTAVPAANKGYCSLLETNHLINVLTLGAANSWTNLATITAMLAFIRPPVLPNWDVGDKTSQYIDILTKDFNLASNLVMQEIYGNSTPFKTVKEIELAQNDIITNF